MRTLAIYLMAGPETPLLAEAAVEGGADLVEIGFPHSDPLADGPIIRRAAERALALGMRTDACLMCLADTRARVDVPLVPMTYTAVLEARAQFATEAREAGATSLIVADLPLEVHPNLHRVHLVAPTTPSDRIRLAAERTDGWLYLVSLTGTTGPRASLSPRLAELTGRARSVTDVPLLAGFGISTPEQVAEAAELVDGVVVGSAAVQIAEDDGPRALRDFVSGLRHALDATSALRVIR